MHVPAHDVITSFGADRLGVVEKLILVNAGPRAHEISIIGGWTDADGLGGTAVQVAHLVGEPLEHVGGLIPVVGAEDFVVQYGVVSWAGGACLGVYVSNWCHLMDWKGVRVVYLP